MDLIGFFAALLSNVPVGWANTLSWSMLVVVAVFLISGPALVYTYYKKYKRERAASVSTAA